MFIFLEIIVYGAVQSSIYALLAMGFCLIFGVANIVNLAHTALYMIGAYLIYTFFSVLHVNLAMAILLSVVGVGVLGMGMYRYCIRPVMFSEWSVMMITISLAMFFQQLMIFLYGPADRNVEGFIEKKFSLFGVVDIDAQRLLTLVVSVLLLVLLWLFIYRTRMGKAILAVAQDREAALFMGINSERVYLTVIGISAALAAVGGAFIAPTIGARPDMWAPTLGRIFAVVVLGGIGSLEGTILAALLIGYLEVIISFSISSYFGEIVSVIVILLMLSFRPSGILGKRIEA
jgi:branched-chain amino acid transport system permease protein